LLLKLSSLGPQKGWSFFAELFDFGGKISNTTDPLIRSRGLIRLSKSMKIIDMENPDFSLFPIRKRQGEKK
jgi:hypothetical protein